MTKAMKEKTYKERKENQSRNEKDQGEYDEEGVTKCLHLTIVCKLSAFQKNIANIMQYHNSTCRIFKLKQVSRHNKTDHNDMMNEHFDKIFPTWIIKLGKQKVNI